MIYSIFEDFISLAKQYWFLSYIEISAKIKLYIYSWQIIYLFICLIATLYTNLLKFHVQNYLFIINKY